MSVVRGAGSPPGRRSVARASVEKGGHACKSAFVGGYTIAEGVSNLKVGLRQTGQMS